MKKTYKDLAHDAGRIRKKYKLSPFEAACCALWLAGANEKDLIPYAERMAEIKSRRYKDGETF